MELSSHPVGQRRWRRAGLGELESAVMDELWAADEPLSVRQVHERLIGIRPIAYTTAMTVLNRLTRKRLVIQRRGGRAFQYAPLRTRDELVAELLLDVLRQVDGPSDRTATLVRFVDRVGVEGQAALREALTRLGAPGNQAGSSCELC